MMKRILCFVLCLMLAVPAALAETADTLQKKFTRQLTAGNGIRGKISITASGVAEWLNVLLPFVGTDIQLRAIGEMQRDLSQNVAGDDDWQIRLYMQNDAGQEVGNTWLYGDPEGIYLQSELLPETLLTIPVEQVNLLYQIFRGEYDELFFAFDPYDMTTAGANGNPAAYQVAAELFDVAEDEWAANWMPVLEKYFLHLDLWLTGYGDPSFMTGDTGAMTMSATYTIPAEDVKAKAKYIVGQMMFDNELQNLLLPYVTMEQRVTYLNPAMVYFYDACIDALPLEGDIILAREMSALGEIVSTTIALPLPPLPDNLTGPIGEIAANALELPYDDLLSGVNRLSMVNENGVRTLTLSGEKRTITLAMAADTSGDEFTTAVNGTLRIMPNIGVEENSLSAAYVCSYRNQVWQDDNYLDHDTTQFTFAVEPDLDMLSEDDPFRSTYVDFAPVKFDCEVDYRNNAFQENSGVQVNISAAADMKDAAVAMDTVLRITTKVDMETLETNGGENMLTLSEERKEALLQMLAENAIKALIGDVIEAPAADQVIDETSDTGEEANAEVAEAPPTNE